MKCNSKDREGKTLKTGSKYIFLLYIMFEYFEGVDMACKPAWSYSFGVIRLAQCKSVKTILGVGMVCVKD